jgi:hypothetical protein
LTQKAREDKKAMSGTRPFEIKSNKNSIRIKRMYQQLKEITNDLNLFSFIQLKNSG